MDQNATQKLFVDYDAKFGNFDEIFLPEFLGDPRFTDLLKTALKRSTPLTQDEITKVIPDASWKW